MDPALATLEDQCIPLQRLLRERLHSLLAPLAQPLRVDVRRALEAEGKLLWHPDHPSEQPAGVWGQLTLLVARQVSPEVDPRIATSVAVAVESYICALDLLDDIEDRDGTPVVEELGTARVLSVATTLLFLTQQALLETARFLVPEQGLRLLEALSTTSLTATVGQHLDLLTEEKPVATMTARECLEIIAAKSGSLMSLACRLGALCAGADGTLCEQWAELGELLGVAHQLDNDAHEDYDTLLAACDFTPALPIGETGDGKRYKKTLPVVLAAQIYEQRKRGCSPQGARENLTMRTLALQEAIALTSAKALLYRERVREAVLQLAGTRRLAPALCQLLGISAP